MNPIPPDNPQRNLTIAAPEDPDRPHIGVAGDTYTILLSGKETAGRYCLIDMHIPPGGGPPPRRHDFEESFTILEGEIEAVFRGPHATATPALPRIAGRTGRIFHGSGRPRNHQNNAATGTRSNRAGKAESQNPRLPGEISNRIAIGNPCR